VVPFFNEEEIIRSFIYQINQVMNSLNKSFEIVLVDDGSSDYSGLKAKNALTEFNIYNSVLITLSRNFGKEAALSAGLDNATGGIVIPIDADLQDPPELIGKMIKKWEEGFDVVYAVRKKRKGESPFRRLSSYLFYRIIRYLSKTNIPLDTGDFRLMDRDVVEAIKKLPEKTRFMKGIFSWVGFRQTAIYFNRNPRIGATSNWNFISLWNFAVDGITSFSKVPLQILSSIGALISFLAIIYSLFLVIRTIIFGITVPGYASIIVTILFLGGIQLIALGVLGEYLGRVFEEVKNRPIYLIRSKYKHHN